MCGRYLTPDQAALERAWQLKAPTGFRQTYNLAPSQAAPVILRGDGGMEGDALDIQLVAWGFQPHWAKRAWINARAETVFTSRAFSHAAERRRCLVPAVGWYEWQVGPPPRQPWLFHLDGFVPFAFAGIVCPASAERAAGFAILTTEASPGLGDIHSRMPVAFDAPAQRRWMSRGLGREEAAALLADPIVQFARYRVSTYVNKPDNNDAACITPLDR